MNPPNNDNEIIRTPNAVGYEKIAVVFAACRLGGGLLVVVGVDFIKSELYFLSFFLFFWGCWCRRLVTPAHVLRRAHE